MCFLFPLTQRVWWVCLVLFFKKKNFLLWLCELEEELGHVGWHSYLP